MKPENWFIEVDLLRERNGNWEWTLKQWWREAGTLGENVGMEVCKNEILA